MIKAIKNLFLKGYILKHKIPLIKEDSLIRLHLVFIGKVQRVGFRDQIRIMAEMMNITGYVRNIGTNKVVSELQGNKEYLDFLVKVIKAEKRFILESVLIDQIGIVNKEMKFVIIKI